MPRARQTVKTRPNYNESIGQALGVEGAEQSGPDFNTLQPLLKLKLEGGVVQVGWTWQGQSAFLDMIEIQVDRGTGGGFAMLTYDTTPATPTRPRSPRRPRNGNTAPSTEWATSAWASGAARWRSPSAAKIRPLRMPSPRPARAGRGRRMGGRIRFPFLECGVFGSSAYSSRIVKIESEFDRYIPVDVIEHAVSTFLNEAEWLLEFGERTIEIPKNPPPMLISRAFVVAHAPDVFLGDHFEAVVALHPESVAGGVLARAGYLKLYFDRSGRFISEDRYSSLSSAHLGHEEP